MVADIIIGKKTVLDYILKPVMKARQNALTERRSLPCGDPMRNPERVSLLPLLTGLVLLLALTLIGSMRFNSAEQREILDRTGKPAVSPCVHSGGHGDGLDRRPARCRGGDGPL